ncbi:ead/Ea22-like family protein [Klebsiella pneumoniae]|uniref:ead/Ea22-like family protein n=1 Tax=Klebsiella pneumoniae TaxID=573 RepID=UPI00211BBC77|nr:ead/Ea22-like family protein [Klebsiella pneumoniae]
MTDITELALSLKAAAEKASNGDWVKESGDGWEACCSANDQANGGFIIAHFVGPDAAENREFVQAANPANVLALVEALEYYKSREERVTSLVRDNSKSWDELYRQVEAKGKRNVELVEALEKAQQQTTESENRVRKQNRHICELFDDNTALRQRIAELESRTVKLPDLRQIVSGDRYVWSDGVYNYSQDVKVVLAAAGIKMEVE